MQMSFEALMNYNLKGTYKIIPVTKEWKLKSGKEVFYCDLCEKAKRELWAISLGEEDCFYNWLCPNCLFKWFIIRDKKIKENETK